LGHVIRWNAKGKFRVIWLTSSLSQPIDRMVSMSAGTQPFTTPVVIDLGRGGHQRPVASPREALECLRSWHWPDNSGLAYEQAVSLSLRAISGLVPLSAAREAFVAAARRAHVLADEESVPVLGRSAARVKTAALALTKAAATGVTRAPRPAT
jgi:hypothetical protein